MKLSKPGSTALYGLTLVLSSSLLACLLLPEFEQFAPTLVARFAGRSSSSLIEFDSSKSSVNAARSKTSPSSKRETKDSKNKGKAALKELSGDSGRVDEQSHKIPARARRQVSTGRGGRPSQSPLRSPAQIKATTRRARTSSGALSLPNTQDLVVPSEQTDELPDNDAEEEEEEIPELGPVVPTPITGKIMSRSNYKGLGGVAVTGLVFHPLAQVAGAPNWVVAYQGVSDDKGGFALDLEVPEDVAAGAAIGLVFQHPDHKALGGVPIQSIVPGKANSVGVFWLRKDSVRLQGELNPAYLAEGGSVVDSGGLNPLAWDAQVRDSILNLLPSYQTPDDLFEQQIGHQDSGFNGQRWLSFRNKGAWAATQAVRWTKVEVEREGEFKKETIGQVKFSFGPDSSYRGSVSIENGGSVVGAVVTTVSSELAQSEITGSNGGFRFAALPSSLRAFRVDHPEFRSQEFPFDAGNPSKILILKNRRPNIPLVLVDSVSGDPITKVTVTVRGQAVKGQATPTQVLELQSPTGQYRITAAFLIESLQFESEGFFAKTLKQANNYPSQALEVTMTAARILSLTARENVAKSSGWSNIHESSLVTYWGNKWLEFEIDHGEELSAFDFEIGVRNQGLIDHKYKFRVRVESEGESRRELSILASQSQTLSQRISLGAHKGRRRVRVTWLNDRFIKGQLDANIVVDWVKFHQRPLSPEEETAER